MLPLYLFLIRNDTWILYFCILAIAWYLVQFLRARSALQRTYFGLERERATARRNGAFLWLLTFFGIAAVTVYVSLQIAPTIPAADRFPPTITPDAIGTLLVTDTPPPQVTPRAELPTATPIIAPTATLREPANFNIEFVEGRPTALPELVVDAFTEGCDAEAVIVEPQTGETVAGGVSLFGRASAEAFNYFQLDILGPQTDGLWQALVAGVSTTPVNSGFLGSADLSSWQTGVYQIRLDVVDGSGNTDRCIIQLGVIGVGALPSAEEEATPEP